MTTTWNALLIIALSGCTTHHERTAEEDSKQVVYCVGACAVISSDVEGTTTTVKTERKADEQQ